MEEKLDFKQMKLFIRILRMTYCFYQVKKHNFYEVNIGKIYTMCIFSFYVEPSTYPFLILMFPPPGFYLNFFIRLLTISTVRESTLYPRRPSPRRAPRRCWTTGWAPARTGRRISTTLISLTRKARETSCSG